VRESFYSVLTTEKCGQMRKSIQLSLAAVFGALHVVLYFISFGFWRNWAIYIAPLEGIILGPNVGFFAALFGSSIARMIKPESFLIINVFGIVAEPISVLSAGLLARAKWKPVLIIYVVMIAAYFIHPYGRALPVWTILDILFALLLIIPTAKLSRNLFTTSPSRMAVAVVLLSFICVATDSLVRVFLLVPMGLSELIFGSYESLYAGFVGAAVFSYIEDAIVVVVSFVVGVPLMILMRKSKFLERVGILKEKTS
jgi:hypothetical protein